MEEAMNAPGSKDEGKLPNRNIPLYFVHCTFCRQVCFFVVQHHSSSAPEPALASSFPAVPETARMEVGITSRLPACTAQTSLRKCRLRRTAVRTRRLS